MATIYGELSADHREIFLVAGGTATDELAYAAKLLQTLTPLCKVTDPPGAIVLPASWPAAVQLAHVYGDSWCPSPDLAAWVTEQVLARTTPAANRYKVPDGLTPYRWQLEGAAMIGATGHTLITDEPGTGKTVTAILGLVERWGAYFSKQHDDAIEPILVICPASVVDHWVRSFRTWAPHWRTTSWRGPKRKQMLGQADVYVTSYDTARIDAPSASKGVLTQLKPAGLVIDECFPAGTQVSTPHGPCAIEDLCVGDEVIGIDHETGHPVVTTVKHTFERDTAEELVSVRGVEMTPNHPVWTGRGYVPADSVSFFDLMTITRLRSSDGDLHADVRMVWGNLHQGRQAHEAPTVLQHELFREMANVQIGVRRVARLGEAAGGGSGKHEALAGESRGASQTARAPARTGQPVARSGGAGQGTDGAAGAGLLDAERWQRPADGAAEAAGRSAGMGYGGRRTDRSQAAVAVGVQGGRGVTGAVDRNRDRRGEPQESEGPRAGRPEGPATDGAGLGGIPVHEQAGAGQDGSGGSGDPRSRLVFNIETGTGNYLVGPEGLLVHNCHLIKNHQAQRSQAVRRLAKHANAVIALSGTPITHHPADLWPTLVALEPGAWPARERWVERYCQTVPGDYDEQILGLSPYTEPEFRMTLLGQHRRVAKADVLADLPPKVYSQRTVELPTAHRKAYDQFEATMLAELPDDGGELSVMSVMAQFTHLAAMASAPADVRITTEVKVSKETGLEEEVEHVHLDLKAPSWKVNALLEVLEERPGQPVLAFAPSRQLMQLAGAAAAETGLRVGYIVGGQSMGARDATVTAFQAGELDLICATTQAGGVGLTLTAAGTVVFLQRPWSLVDSIQAEDRAHRIGQEAESVEIIDIVASNTIDTRVRAVLRERAGQLADLVQDPRIVAEILGGASTKTQLKKAS